MTEIVTKIRNKMKEKENICVIIKWDDVIKRLLNSYVRENPFQTEELSERAGK